MSSLAQHQDSPSLAPADATRIEAGAVLGPALVFACSLGGQLLAIWISIRPGIARI